VLHEHVARRVEDALSCVGAFAFASFLASHDRVRLGAGLSRAYLTWVEHITTLGRTQGPPRFAR
jgi:hypothetical protein